MLHVFTSQMNDDKFGFLRSCCREANISVILDGSNFFRNRRCYYVQGRLQTMSLFHRVRDPDLTLSLSLLRHVASVLVWSADHHAPLPAADPSSHSSLCTNWSWCAHTQKHTHAHIWFNLCETYSIFISVIHPLIVRKLVVCVCF